MFGIREYVLDLECKTSVKSENLEIVLRSDLETGLAHPQQIGPCGSGINYFPNLKHKLYRLKDEHL